MAFGKAVEFNALQTSRIIHNLSNDVFISNNIINNLEKDECRTVQIPRCVALWRVLFSSSGDIRPFTAQDVHFFLNKCYVEKISSTL